MSMPRIPDAQTVRSTLKTGMTYKLYIALGAGIGLAVFFAWLMKVEPIYSFVDGFMLEMSGAAKVLVNNLGLMVKDAIDYFNANPIPAVIGLVTAGGTVYGLVSKIQGDRARAESERYANEQIMETQKKLIETGQQHLLATQKVDALEGQLEVYKNDTSFTEAQSVIQNLKTQLSTKNETISELEKLLADLKTKETVVVH